MIDRLEYDPDQPERARRELDRALDVDLWRVPGVPLRAPRRDVEGRRAPAWWHGDEDASQSFLHAVGVMT